MIELINLVKPDTYFVYQKSVRIEFYSSNGAVAGLSRIINGYCNEVAVYNVTRSGIEGFIIEKHRIVLENKSSAPYTCRYLLLVDAGEKKTWNRLNNPSTIVMMFDWKYPYHGPVFTSTYYNGYPLPWAKHMYIYMSMNSSTYTYNISSTTAPTHGINGLNTIFYNMFEAEYDRGDGFLKYLKYTVAIHILGKPYAAITLVINRIKTHYTGAHVIGSSLWNKIVLYVIIIVIFSISTIWLLKKKLG
jgi:hypothetical protein